MLMHKVLSSLLVVMLGLGNMPCACAAMANIDDAAGTHAHHQEATQHPSENSNRSCSCDANCDELSAVVVELGGILPSANIYQFDDMNAIETETVAYPQSSRLIALHDPPLVYRWRPPETPVLRYDRLLD